MHRFEGLPDAYSNAEGIPIGHLYWLWWIVKCWGLYHYAQKRYAPLEGALKAWDDEKSLDENTKPFGYVPGVSLRPEREDKLRDILHQHPKRDHIVLAIKQVHQWLHSGGCLARNEKPDGIDDCSGWHNAYDLQPNKPFPER